MSAFQPVGTIMIVTARMMSSLLLKGEGNSQGLVRSGLDERKPQRRWVEMADVGRRLRRRRHNRDHRIYGIRDVRRLMRPSLMGAWDSIFLEHRADVASSLGKDAVKLIA